MDEERGGARGFFGQDAGRGGIDGVGLFGLGLCAIDGGVGSGVEDDGGREGADGGAKCGLVGEIKRGVGVGLDLTRAGEAFSEGLAELATGAEQKDARRSAHAKTSAVASGAPC